MCWERKAHLLSKDPAETKGRHFLDKRSYVRNDATEVLYGVDWKIRVSELWNRCGGRCEKVIIEMQPVARRGRIAVDSTAERCRSEAADPHHIVKRSKYRDDRLSNLQALCRMHHELLDNRKTRFGEGKRQGGKA